MEHAQEAPSEWFLCCIMPSGGRPDHSDLENDIHIKSCAALRKWAKSTTTSINFAPRQGDYGMLIVPKPLSLPLGLW
eukprot:5772137-Amphidinium_carterae.1